MKEMMKRIICLLCACMMIVGCSNQVDNPNKDEETTIIDKENENHTDLNEGEVNKKFYPVSSIFEVSTSQNANNYLSASQLTSTAIQNIDIESIVFVSDESKDEGYALEWIITNDEAFNAFKNWSAAITDITTKTESEKGYGYAIQIKTSDGITIGFKGIGNSMFRSNEYSVFNGVSPIEEILKPYMDNPKKVHTIDMNAFIEGDSSFVYETQGNESNQTSKQSFIKVTRYIGELSDKWLNALQMVFYLSDFDESNQIESWDDIAAGLAFMNALNGCDGDGAVCTNNLSDRRDSENLANGWYRIVPQEFVERTGKSLFGETFTLENVKSGHMEKDSYLSFATYNEEEKIFIINLPYEFWFPEMHTFQIIDQIVEGNKRIYHGLFYTPKYIFPENGDITIHYVNDQNEEYEKLEGNEHSFNQSRIILEEINGEIKIVSYEMFEDDSEKKEIRSFDSIEINQQDSNHKDTVQENQNDEANEELITIKSMIESYKKLQIKQINFDKFNKNGKAEKYYISNKEDVDLFMNAFKNLISTYTYNDVNYGYGGKRSDIFITLYDLNDNPYYIDLFVDEDGQSIALNEYNQRVKVEGENLLNLLNENGQLYDEQSNFLYVDHNHELKAFTGESNPFVWVYAQMEKSGTADELQAMDEFIPLAVNAMNTFNHDYYDAIVDRIIQSKNILNEEYRYAYLFAKFTNGIITHGSANYYEGELIMPYLLGYERLEGGTYEVHYILEKGYNINRYLDFLEMKKDREYRFLPEKFGLMKVTMNTMCTDILSVEYIRNAPDTKVIIPDYSKILNPDGTINEENRNYDNLISRALNDVRNNSSKAIKYQMEENDEYISFYPLSESISEFAYNKIIVRKSDGYILSDETLNKEIMNDTLLDVLASRINQKGYEVCDEDNQSGVCVKIPSLTIDSAIEENISMSSSSFYLKNGNWMIDIPVYRDGWLIDKLTVQVK